jgi:hypothetical protein
LINDHFTHLKTYVSVNIGRNGFITSAPEVPTGAEHRHPVEEAGDQQGLPDSADAEKCNILLAPIFLTRKLDQRPIFRTFFSTESDFPRKIPWNFFEK